MKSLARPNIFNIKPYTPGKPIEEVERELAITGVKKLASNENCFGPSPKAVAAIKKNIAKLNRYPDANSFYLKRALAKYLGVKPENLVIGNGSDEVIVLAAKAFLDAGDEVVVAKPTFLIYEIASGVQGAVIRTVPAKDGFKYDLKKMKEAISPRTKIVFIANPDNPTGTYVARDELDEFFDGLPDSVIVFLDEAYFEFARFSKKDYPNGIDYLSRPNVIVARSFSKAYGLAGLRVGYGIANPELINFLERVREPFNVNLLAQAGALAALDDKVFLKKTLRHTEEEKEFIYTELKKMGLVYTPSATNFILVDTGADCVKVFKSMLKKGVIIRDMKAWGLDTYIRVTIGARVENRQFIKALKEALKGITRRSAL